MTDRIDRIIVTFTGTVHVQVGEQGDEVGITFPIKVGHVAASNDPQWYGARLMTKTILDAASRLANETFARLKRYNLTLEDNDVA